MQGGDGMVGISKIGVWGDSILKGVIFDAESGRYRLIRNGAVHDFAQLFHLDVKNHSHFGCTAPKGMASLDRTLSEGFDADMVLLEFGGNDCDYDWADVSSTPLQAHQPNTVYEDFTAAMTQMIRALLDKGIRPVLMNLPPIDSVRFFDWITKPENVDPDRVLTFLGEKENIYRHQERYSHAIESLAREYNLLLVDVRDAFLREGNLGAFLCADGIHPNEKGQRLIQDVFSSCFSRYALA